MKIRERGRNKKKKGKKGAADLEPRLLQNKRKRDASKRGGDFYFVNQRPAKVPFELCRRVDGGYLKILGDGI